MKEQTLKVIEGLELLHAIALVENSQWADTVESVMKELMWMYGELTRYE